MPCLNVTIKMLNPNSEWGFLTSENRSLNRKEACAPEFSNKLYSEDLY